MELVNLKKEEESRLEMASKPEPYPYGLCIHLDTDTLKKLGITDLPEVGSEFKLLAKAIVKSTHESEYLNEKENKCMDLQITDMAVKLIDNRSDSEIMYGKGK